MTWDCTAFPHPEGVMVFAVVSLIFVGLIIIGDPGLVVVEFLLGAMAVTGWIIKAAKWLWGFLSTIWAVVCFPFSMWVKVDREDGT